MKRSTLMYLNAIAWGVVAFTLTLFALWSFTMMDIFEVLFLSIIVYLLVVGAALWITEPKKPEKKDNWSPDDVPFYTIGKEDWHGENR